MISGEKIHTLISFMVSVMASNLVDGLAWVSSVCRQHNLYKCSYLSDMQLLGAHAHNILLFWSVMTRVVALLQS